MPANWREVARTDPAEARELWEARYGLTVEQYNSSTISHDCFVAALFALGFRGQELECERRRREQIKFDLTGSWQ